MKSLILLPESEYYQRLLTTQRLMRERGLDGLIAFASYAERDGHVGYLTNHRISFPNVMSHIGMGYAAVVLSTEGECALVAPMGYQRERVVNVDRSYTGYNLVTELISAVKQKHLETKRIGLVGLDVVPNEYYVALRQGVERSIFVKADDILEGQRAIKSQAEIELLRKAARIADVALTAGLEVVGEGVVDYEIELAARRAALAAGADFIPRVRVSSGKAITTLTWPMASGRQLENGDFVYLDFIGWGGGYGFDNSRVTVIGKPSDAQQDYLNQLVQALDTMIGQLKPETELTFNPTQHDGITITPFGHGIGIEICETPWILGSGAVRLEPGMVLCIEPIASTSDFGGMALEDTVAVTEDGVDILNQCPRVFW
jgi:Xaa-Pro aminopeptidase